MSLYSDTPKPTPQEIRLARLQKNLTQEEAGAVVGVERRYWSKWETGVVPMTIETWIVFLLLTDAHPTYRLASVVEDKMTKVTGASGPTEHA